MKALILAAGYATRLYPLTENTPKPLLEVAGKTILDYIVEKLDQVNEIDEIIIVTNDKFAGHFQAWVDQADYSKPFKVINDGTLSNDSRLGAIGDIQFVVDQTGLHDDLMVLAGDNLFHFALSDFADFFTAKGTDVIAAYEESDHQQLLRSGVVKVDDNNQALAFEEKSSQPMSNLSVPTFYIFQADTLDLIQTYLDQGGNPDAPGHFIPYLIDHKPVNVYIFTGGRHDIGTVDSYRQVQALYEQS
ncbi:hypothetical protein AWM75_03190 [Aerococcus urinaehominis]|uniref:Uncharacterized protein n=1 Tax=Aerococcus urinaehominis TaxID=128944 RepID=A0A0X8FKN8_9LACT|nr:nucleotidyltransferase family protein [Aerococcus urinaehominis]AMB99065.1 hypothetical protein AWM75_03190 [Aerococcus urinaehominis]SDM59650.1 glucose-1-phosphate thymidylyltransferase [Aerococcus urinaehominis]